ncbi:MAG: hypothetical protein RMM51_12370 [Verrucomicrobiae bacterium]|nr:hypothetical protein [Verrucomicrobiae bacterium]
MDTTKNVFKIEITRRSIMAYILGPGEFSLHDARQIHGLPTNPSAIRPDSYTMCYMFTPSKRSHEGLQWHQAYIGLGRDQAGNPYADPTKTHPELIERRVTCGKKGH